jgi:amino-acid N-acetyltransferase
MRIGEAGRTDTHTIRTLLAEAGLPFDDLKDSGPARFLIARDEDAGVGGVVGLEVYGKSGLLRSLVVTPDERQRGLGAQLTLDLEHMAKDLGVETLYLLTTTAEEFFAKRGYQRIERTLVPQEIGVSAEFKFLCPSNAVCMYRRLDK